MKKSDFIGIAVICILIISGVILFFTTADRQARQDYFEGRVLENTGDHITVKIDPSYENLTAELGETVKIEKKDVVKECDFSDFAPDEMIRVLYGGINSSNREIEQVFAVYALSELG